MWCSSTMGWLFLLMKGLLHTSPILRKARVQLWLVSYAHKTGSKGPLWQVLSFESLLYLLQCSLNYRYNAAFPTEFVYQSSIHVMSKSGDNIGRVWSKIYMSRKCQFEDVTIIPLHHMPRSSLSCLLAFYSIPIFHTFLIRIIFFLLASFPFLPHTHALGHNVHI